MKINIENNEDFSAEDFRSELKTSSSDYDIGSFFGNVKSEYQTNDEQPDYSAYDQIYDEVIECERFMKSKAGILFINRLVAIRNTKINEFASAKPNELLKCQSEFNAWESVIYTATSFGQEKEYLEENMGK